MDICHFCLKPAEGDLLQCGSCFAAFYCGIDCQKNDWKASHRSECKTPLPDSHESFHKYCIVLTSMDYFYRKVDEILPVRTANMVIFARISSNPFKLEHLKKWDVNFPHPLLPEDMLQTNVRFQTVKGSDDACIVICHNQVGPTALSIATFFMRVDAGKWPKF